uniref:Uncharacterized protein n=1 Tax=Rhizophora mucronata TaxID=61149 RepID=A0A2P2Q046_RHIMU
MTAVLLTGSCSVCGFDPV